MTEAVAICMYTHVSEGDLRSLDTLKARVTAIVGHHPLGARYLAIFPAPKSTSSTISTLGVG